MSASFFSSAVEMRSSTTAFTGAGAGSAFLGAALGAADLIPEIGENAGLGFPAVAARGFRGFGPSINESVSTGATGAAGSAADSAALFAWAGVALAGAAEAALAPAGFLAAGAGVPARLRVAGVLLLLAGGEERGIWIITKRYVGDQRLLQPLGECCAENECD